VLVAVEAAYVRNHVHLRLLVLVNVNAVHTDVIIIVMKDMEDIAETDVHIANVRALHQALVLQLLLALALVLPKIAQIISLVVLMILLEVLLLAVVNPNAENRDVPAVNPSVIIQNDAAAAVIKSRPPPRVLVPVHHLKNVELVSVAVVLRDSFVKFV